MCLLYDIYLLLLSNRNIGPTTVRFWTIRIYYANLSSLTPETPALRHWSWHHFNLSPLIILVTLNMRINPEVELRLYSSASFVISWCDMSIIFDLMNLIYYILSLSKCRITPCFSDRQFLNLIYWYHCSLELLSYLFYLWFSLLGRYKGFSYGKRKTSTVFQYMRIEKQWTHRHIFCKTSHKLSTTTTTKWYNNIFYRNFVCVVWILK